MDKLYGSTYAIIPDMIEAGTYMCAAAATRGRLRVNNVIPKHLESISAKLEEMGVEIIENDDSVEVCGNGELRRVNIKTLPYPASDRHEPADRRAVMSRERGILPY